MISLPLLAVSLLLGMVVVAALGRLSLVFRIAAFSGTFVLALVPLFPWGSPDALSTAGYVRVLTGDPSITTVCLLLLYGYAKFNTPPSAITDDLPRLSLLLGGTALFFYPTALGLTYLDIYGHGFYPVVLYPLLMVLFALAILHTWPLITMLVVIVLLSYNLQLLPSDNLWDYLMDPMVAIYCLMQLPRALRELKWSPVFIRDLLLISIGAVLVFGVFLSHLNHDGFRAVYVKEDGFLEWSTVFVLAALAVITIRRVFLLRHHRSAKFLGVTSLLIVACVFGAGEEISWGQRIFNVETPEFFMENNKQEEIGFHNLIIEIDGEPVRVNKLIFGTGLALGMLIYLCLMTPLYRQKRGFARWLDGMAVPMPRNYHIAGYFIVVAVVELLIDSSKRGEVTEFAASIIFMLNIVFPYNAHIYDPAAKLEPADD
jgi:hypothetical protein